MADAACLNDNAVLLRTTTVSAVTLEGAVLVSDSSYSFDVTPYLNLRTLYEETGVSTSSTSVGCSGGGTGVSTVSIYPALTDTGVL
jgi:hypothetical protein